MSDKVEKLVEVKGIKGSKGGILLTNKEWDTALSEKDKYDLFIVSNIDESPTVTIITNPGDKFSPKKHIQTVIQVNWTLSNNELEKA